MDILKLGLIEKIEEKEKVIINGKELFRTDEVRDLNEMEGYWVYGFKDKKRKKKRTHQVVVHVKFEKNTRKEKWVTKKYVMGELLDVKLQSRAQINSIS